MIDSQRVQVLYLTTDIQPLRSAQRGQTGAPHQLHRRDILEQAGNGGLLFHLDTQPQSGELFRGLLYENWLRYRRVKEKGILGDERIVEFGKSMVWVHER